MSMSMSMGMGMGMVIPNGVKIRQSTFIAAYRNSLSYRLSNPAEASFRGDASLPSWIFDSPAYDYLTLDIISKDSRQCLQQSRKK